MRRRIFLPRSRWSGSKLPKLEVKHVSRSGLNLSYVPHQLNRYPLSNPPSQFYLYRFHPLQFFAFSRLCRRIDRVCAPDLLAATVKQEPMLLELQTPRRLLGFFRVLQFRLAPGSTGVVLSQSEAFPRIRTRRKARQFWRAFWMLSRIRTRRKALRRVVPAHLDSTAS